MSKLLTLGILQQVQNAQGGGDDGVLYDGEMTVGSGGATRYGYDSINYGSVSPTVSGWTLCYVEKGISGDVFYGNYPNIGSVLAHYEFGGTVYTSAESLYNYLSGQVDNTISLKVYEDAQ